MANTKAPAAPPAPRLPTSAQEELAARRALAHQLVGQAGSRLPPAFRVGMYTGPSRVHADEIGIAPEEPAAPVPSTTRANLAAAWDRAAPSLKGLAVDPPRPIAANRPDGTK